jgi:hypothetical protein
VSDCAEVFKRVPFLLERKVAAGVSDQIQGGGSQLYSLPFAGRFHDFSTGHNARAGWEFRNLIEVGKGLFIDDLKVD